MDNSKCSAANFVLESIAVDSMQPRGLLALLLVFLVGQRGDTTYRRVLLAEEPLHGLLVSESHLMLLIVFSAKLGGHGCILDGDGLNRALLFARRVRLTLVEHLFILHKRLLGAVQIEAYFFVILVHLSADATVGGFVFRTPHFEFHV